MHYELYIDLFFLENFMMDSLLLFVTERITGGKYSLKEFYQELSLEVC